MSVLARAILAAALVAMVPGASCRQAAAATPGETVADAARRVVKVYGAGGVRGLEGYQSGILVSPAGHVVTAHSTVLDSDGIDCVLDDGRRFPATVIGVDPRRELAVLSIAGEDLPAFTLPGPDDQPPPPDGRAPPGTRVFALSNLFSVAVGDERVSAQHGVVSAVVPLEARRGAHEAPYRGDVYLLDFTTSNPGSAGGALVDWRGRLVGMLGKELRATATGVWLNYALPVDEVSLGYRQVTGDGPPPPPPPVDTPPFDPTRFGVVLVPDLLDTTPPFVESVRDGSAAAAAGLLPDDLVVAVNGRAVASRAALQRALGAVADGDAVELTVIRAGEIAVGALGPKPAGGTTP